MELKAVLVVIKEWIGLLTPFTIALGLLWKWWLKKRYAEIKELFSKVQLISDEFRPNGGSTLRDAINRIEHSVTTNEQKTLALIKSMPMGIWISDKNGKCTDVNRSICNLTGRTESELKGDNWSNWIHPDEQEDVFQDWNRCVNNDMNFDQIYRYILPNGQIKQFHGVAYQLKDRNNNLIGFLGTLTEVS